MKQLKLVPAAIPAAFGRLFALFGFFAFFAVVAAKGGGGNFNFRRAFGAVCLSAILGIGNAAFAAHNDRDADGLTFLHHAVIEGDRRRAEDLVVQQRAKTEITTVKSGETALHLAARYDRADIAKVLIKARANINAQANNGRTPLHMAARNGRAEVARALIKAGANPEMREEYGKTPLHFAGGFDEDDIAKMLIEAGANIDAKDSDGKTPLHWAMQEGKARAVRALVAAGADKEAKDNNGRTPLRLAVEVGTENVTAELLEALGKANDRFVNHGDSNGMTPLHYAAVSNNARYAFALIKAGADLDKPDTRGRLRPLHYAARNGSIEALHVLIKAGADIYAKSHLPREKLPVDSAKKYRKWKAKDILRDAGMKACQRNTNFWNQHWAAYTCPARHW